MKKSVILFHYMCVCVCVINTNTHACIIYIVYHHAYIAQISRGVCASRARGREGGAPDRRLGKRKLRKLDLGSGLPAANWSRPRSRRVGLAAAPPARTTVQLPPSFQLRVSSLTRGKGKTASTPAREALSTAGEEGRRMRPDASCFPEYGSAA